MADPVILSNQFAVVEVGAVPCPPLATTHRRAHALMAAQVLIDLALNRSV